jgi:hypothetical protein
LTSHVKEIERRRFRKHCFWDAMPRRPRALLGVLCRLQISAEMAGTFDDAVVLVEPVPLITA